MKRLLPLLLLAGFAPIQEAAAQVSAMSYQGRLLTGDRPVDGLLTFSFRLMSAESNGVAAPVIPVVFDVPVSNGLFQTWMDFGPESLNGTNRWLEISVSTNRGGSFTALSPRQFLGSAPYAVRAFQSDSAGLALALNGPLPGAALSGNYASQVFLTNAANLLGGDGSRLRGLNATNLAAGTIDDARLSTNLARLNQANTFTAAQTIATAAQSPLEARGSNTGGTWLNLANTAAGGKTWNLISSGPSNGEGAGKLLLRDGSHGVVLTLSSNGNVGIGTVNPAARLDVNGVVQASAFKLTGGAAANAVLASDATGAATWNAGLRIEPTFTASCDLCPLDPATPNVVAGFSGNRSTNGAIGAAVLGGGAIGNLFVAAQPNVAGGDYSVVAGGAGNQALGDYGFAAGRGASALHHGSFVWGDSRNTNTASTGTNQFIVRAGGGVGIGGAPQDAALDVEGFARLNDYDLFFRPGSDRNHGVGWYGTYAGTHIDGPVLYGWSGGALGSKSGGDKVALRWDSQARVGIRTATPEGILDVETGNGRLQIISDLVPTINLKGGTIPGTMRLRNTLEVFPSQDGARVGKIDVRDTNGTPTITLSGTGVATVKVLDITGGSDVAEPFPTKEEDAEPGSVMVIDDEHPGRLKLARTAHDTRVAGVISGANGVQPGLLLRQSGVLDQGKHVALTGRVYVKADAAYGPIKPGDLLTTSDTPGHAMKVRNHAAAQGAILGKAMTALKDGTGHVLVLVTLQ